MTARVRRIASGSMRRGYSLIELVITLVIVAVLLAIAVPKVDIARYRSDAGARLVRGALLSAQRLAVQRQFDVIVSFDTVGNRMRTLEDANNNRVVDTGERVSWRSLEENTLFARPSSSPVGTTVTGSVMGTGIRTIDAMPSVIFRRDGAASGTAEVFITSRTMQPKHFRAITLSQATGRAEWYSFSTLTWKSGGV